MAPEIYQLDGPCLLLASPGTGKTYSLARRVKHLVQEADVPPDRIAVITFTSAAAREMRTRLSSPSDADLYLPPQLQPRTICTMHSLGHTILTQAAPSLGMTAPIRVVSGAAAEILLGDASQLIGLPRAAAASTRDCRQRGTCAHDGSERCKTCEAYVSILSACNAVDHDEQIRQACAVLDAQHGMLEQFQAAATHLLVDEYQDINAAQFRLIQTLAGENTGGLFVVGDDDQSIYSWRGGSPEYIRLFQHHFQPSTVKALTCSRRCHRNILEAALAMLSHFDKSRIAKNIDEYKSLDGPLVHVHSVPSDKREAAIATAIIRDAVPSRSVLVLVPSRAHATLVVEQLRAAGLSFSSQQPTSRDGLPVLSGLWDWVQNPHDSIALRECLQAVLNSGVTGVPGPRAKKPEKRDERERALADVAQLWQLAIERRQSLYACLDTARHSSPIIEALLETLEQIRTIDHKDVAAFAEAAIACTKPWSTTDAMMDEVIRWLRLAEGGDATMPSDIRVMTLQGSKGLEADVVCILGLEQGTMPKEDVGEAELAEQARLMYVSMTRAKTELHLFHARKRSGSVSFQSPYAKGDTTLHPSEFIGAIPAKYRQSHYHKAK